jgi:hypothetical protein
MTADFERQSFFYHSLLRLSMMKKRMKLKTRNLEGLRDELIKINLLK